jgi:hypothetical protein
MNGRRGNGLCKANRPRPKKAYRHEMSKKLQGSDNLIFAEPSPEIRQPQWVQCDHSMRLAVQDKSGKWKSFSNNRELTDFVKVCAG